MTGKFCWFRRRREKCASSRNRLVMSVYAPGELVKKIESSGFKILSVVEWGFPFYSPLYRNFLDMIGSKGTTGEYGLFRKLIAKLIYLVFLLNSSRHGDEIFVLAKINQDTASS